MPENLNFLGKGLRFPFQFTRRTGGVYKGSDVSASASVMHVEESIMQILGTRMGSRVIRRNFGSVIRGIVFDPNDPQMDVQLDYMIRSAIETWEPRVTVGPISIDRTFWKEGRLDIAIQIRIIKTNTIFNMVWPYYLSAEERKTSVTPAAG